MGESHIVDGLLQAVTLIYGSWDQDQPHIRVTTWRDLPGQDFIPDAHDGHDTPDALLAAPPENVTVAIDGRPTPATLRRLPAEAWLLRAAPAPLVNLLASGRGPIADLTFASLPDLEPALAARHACLASRP